MADSNISGGWAPDNRRLAVATVRKGKPVLAIIDTDKDEIVRVMPSGALPKMIATSPDNKFVAVTHWGEFESAEHEMLRLLENHCQALHSAPAASF